MVSSRQRMLAALDKRAADHPPCSFMLYNALKSTCRDYTEFITRQLELGLDAYVQIPARPPVVANDWYNLHGLPVSFDPAVRIEEWVENLPGERWPLMVKEYHTPAGVLRAEAWQDAEWRWGNHIPFLDDYLETRSRKFIVSAPEDLERLQYLLAPPTAAERDAFRRESQPYIDLARRHDLLLAGGWGVGADLLAWVYGLERMIYAVRDDPDFVQAMLQMVASWNRARMELVLEAGVDLYIKRAWYENCDFWSPGSYRKFLAPILQADADLAHRRGARLGYIITANCMPLLDLFAEIGVDVLIGVAPPNWDLAVTKERLKGKVCLWGGVNGHITVETGSAAQVRGEVREALRLLAPGGGFILSPVDNVRQDAPRARRNSLALIDEWMRSWSAGC